MVKLQQIIPNNPNFQFQVADLLNKLTASVVTRSDLVTAGIISTTGTGTGGAVTKPPVGGRVISAPIPITGLVANGSFASILLTWNAVTQSGYSYTEVWRNTVDDLATAIKIGSSIAPMYSDTPPDSKTSIVYYYWVRAVNVNNISGAYNAIAGTVGNTANDPAYALEILTGKLTQTQLHTALSSKIDVITINTTAITTEASARATAVQAEATRINTLAAGLVSPTGSIQSAIAQEAINTLATADSAAASRVATLQTTVNGNTASVQTNATSIDGINAQYTVKTQVDINGIPKIAGFGLISSATTSVFEIMADKFFIAPPAGSAAGSLSPFIVDAAKNMVLMDGASIVDGTITNAHIKNAGIETLLVGKLLTAPIISGGTIKLGNATSLTAGTGVFIDVNAGNGAFRAGNPLGDQIKWDGATLYLKGSAQMALQAGSSISIGDVSGAGSLATLSVVGDSNITSISAGKITTGTIQAGVSIISPVVIHPVTAGTNILLKSPNAHTNITSSYTAWFTVGNLYLVNETGTIRVNVDATGAYGGSVRFLKNGAVLATYAVPAWASVVTHSIDTSVAKNTQIHCQILGSIGTKNFMITTAQIPNDTVLL